MLPLGSSKGDRLLSPQPLVACFHTAPLACLHRPQLDFPLNTPLRRRPQFLPSAFSGLLFHRREARWESGMRGISPHSSLPLPHRTPRHATPSHRPLSLPTSGVHRKQLFLLPCRQIDTKTTRTHAHRHTRTPPLHLVSTTPVQISA